MFKLIINKFLFYLSAAVQNLEGLFKNGQLRLLNEVSRLDQFFGTIVYSQTDIRKLGDSVFTLVLDEQITLDAKR